jgi:hypothetical protein
MVVQKVPKFHKPHARTKWKPPAPTPPPGVALVLISADYHSGIDVVLSFDRAIDVSAFDPSQITMVDVFPHKTFTGGSTSIIDPLTVRIWLVETGPYGGSAHTLTATAATGIVAVDDGGTWAGVTDLNLPFV